MGLVLFVVAIVFDRAVRADEPASPAPPPAETTRALRTPRPDEPPDRIGERYDNDRALPEGGVATTSYTLFAKLDADEHTIDAHGTIRWTNRSARPATDLRFHLYLNAFKNSRSRFLRSPFSGSRSGRRPTDWAAIDIRKLTVNGRNLWKDATKHAPGDPYDQTDISVPLPEPVEPGQTIAIDVAWTSELPDIVERTGYAGRFHMVAQWFPKLARREPDGRWAAFVFHPHSEFYADFGTYDVTLDVPQPMRVGATGPRVESRDVSGRRVVRHRIDDVHDFAWTAWDGFTERLAEIDGVTVRLLVPKGHENNAEATLRAVAHGLDFYGKRFGRYPYSVLTVVHPPRDAESVGGMEYPTLITTGGPWYTSYVSPFIERVTLHELAHQWFYGLVATDEHTWPFLDEGLTSYAESLAMRDLFGTAAGLRLPGLSFDGDAYLRAASAQAARRGPIAQPAPAFANFADLGALVYGRTATLLATIERVYGKEPLVRALGRYARFYRYRHPEPRHFIAAMREVLGDHVADTLRTALFESATVDYIASEVRATPVVPEAGVFDTEKGRETRDSKKPVDPARWMSRALVYRTGTLIFPVEIDLVLESGRRIRHRWDGRERWKTIEHEGPEPAVAVHVDPDVRILIDDNLMNNAASSERHFPWRLLERATYYAELGLGALGP